MHVVENIGERVKYCLNVIGARWVVAASRPVYRSLLRLLYPNGIPRCIHGEPVLYFSWDSRDVPEDKDEGSFGAMKDRIHEGAVVLDIGANVGMYTLLMARWAGPTGKVFAFEPVVQNTDKLQRNINMNKLADRVEVIRTAIGNTVGEMVFYYSPECCGNSSVVASAVPGGRSQVVPVTTVDLFCQSRRIVPTFLKIDVEGYEMHVLEGAWEIIQRYTPDLLIETHPYLWQELALSQEQVIERFEGLAKLGYQYKNLDGGTDYLETGAHLLFWHSTRVNANSPRIPNPT
jgi:FkbM family methyltransferase